MPKSPAIPAQADALASAALSLAAGLGQLLIKKELATKAEIVGLYRELAKSKDAKAIVHDAPAEGEAGDLLAYLADKLEEKKLI